MDVEQAWREEGLTLSGLSKSLNAPDYRVRRAILRRFAARNFPAFVNAYRIEAAKMLLAAADGRTVAEIAYEVGFSSLTAFNRAFKEAVGETPTAWRRRPRDAVES
jgi:AraC-like DNA-binding protein